MNSGFDGSKIQLLRINVRLYPANKGTSNTRITCGMAHLDQCLELPIQRGVLVIMQRWSQRDGRLAFIALRPKPQINAKHPAFSRDARENLGYSLSQANEIFAVGD